MSLIAGSYDRFIWGYRLKSTSGSITLTKLFSYPAHLSPIKAVDVGGSIGVSAAADEMIKLYDLSACTEIAALSPYRSSTTSLSFFIPPSHSFPLNLISTCDDGHLSIFDIDPFVLLKTLTVHRKAVNDLCVHNSGRLALTVGQDSCLAMVNLIRGRRTFYCKLAEEATAVKFDSCGDRFFMAGNHKLSFHMSEDGRLISEVQCPKAVHCVAPGLGGLVFTGGEDMSVTAWDTNSGRIAYCIDGAHSARVKGIVLFANSSGSSDDPWFLASASSDGVIRVWDTRMTIKEKPVPLAEANTQSRLTCIAGNSFKN